VKRWNETVRSCGQTSCHAGTARPGHKLPLKHGQATAEPSAILEQKTPPHCFKRGVIFVEARHQQRRCHLLWWPERCRVLGLMVEHSFVPYHGVPKAALHSQARCPFSSASEFKMRLVPQKSPREESDPPLQQQPSCRSQASEA